jgi:hypothetical protein
MAKRIPKAEADYTAHASNPAHECAVCAHFLGILGCQKVKGYISPHGWCKLWEKAKVRK